MKKRLLLILFCSLVATKTFSQVYTPIPVSGYTLDAVAENTTALATTNGPLDGSNYVLYSAAYGNIYSITGGLPNNGVITSGTYSYQLEPYTQNNVLFIPFSFSDSLTLTTPSSYASLSLLAYATEGTGTMSVTIRFTDNTTQVFSPLTLNDWFGGTTSIVSGFGRAGRLTGVITNPAGQPKMFNVDLNLSCANRLKSVQRVIIQNNSTNARICVMAVSGAGMPVYNSSSTPASCLGGTDGTASLSINNPLPPNTFTWSSTPNQFGAQATNLTPGVYSYTVKDAAGCAQSSTVLVSATTVSLSPLVINASSTLVCQGASVTLSTFGAVSYAWTGPSGFSSNSGVTVVNPTANGIYSVAATNASNCVMSGSIAIHVHSTTPVSFGPISSSFCLNASSSPLSASPSGGSFSGLGVVFGSFYPNLSGAGVFTLSYFYTDANNCSYTATAATSVNPLPQISFSISPSQICLNSPILSLSALPSGGTFGGQGVTGSALSPSLAGAGIANVSYTYTDSNNCSASTTATVTILSLPVITFTPIATSMCVNASTIHLNASPTGGSFSGTGVTGSVFSPSLAGVGIRTLTYAYTSSVTSCSSTKTISTTVSACTGIEDLEADNTFIIYPNPANSFVFLKSEIEMDVTMFNELGQCLKTLQLSALNNFTYDFGNLPTGIYFIVASTNKVTVKKKLIVQN